MLYYLRMNIKESIDDCKGRSYVLIYYTSEDNYNETIQGYIITVTLFALNLVMHCGGYENIQGNMTNKIIIMHTFNMDHLGNLQNTLI